MEKKRKEMVIEEESIDSRLKTVALSGLVLAGILGSCSLYLLVTGSGDIFYQFLTAHLSLALHLWLPVVEIILFRACYSSLVKREPGFSGVTFWSVTAGFFLMVAGIVTGIDRAIPIDYAPFFYSPLFFCGMVTIYITWLFNSMAPLIAFRRYKLESQAAMAPWWFAGYATASIAAMVTAVNTILGFITVPSGLEIGFFIEASIYGGGHSIQFVHISLMIALWAKISGFPKSDRFGKVAQVVFTLIACLALLTPAMYLFDNALEQTRQSGWTLLLGIGLGSFSMIAAMTVILGMRWSATMAPVILLSFACFLVGGWAPGLADRTSLSLTAHFHGLLGGFTATFLLVVYQSGNREDWRKAFLFGAGILVLAFSFADLSSLPLLRKASTLAGVYSMNPLAATGLLAGGLISGIGVIWIAFDKEKIEDNHA